MPFLIKQNKNFYTSIFFISLFLIGIYIFPDFGIGVDEDNSRVNGFVSLKYIFEIFFPDNVFRINDIMNVPNINKYSEQRLKKHTKFVEDVIKVAEKLYQFVQKK